MNDTDATLAGMPLITPPPPDASAATRAEWSARRYATFGWATLDPQRLGWMLRSFLQGYYVWCVPAFEAILATDAYTVSQKRYRAVSGLDWEIATINDSDEAKAQAEYLEDFYDALDVSNVEARDMAQGVESLVHHLMSATALRYAASELEWTPARLPDGRATWHARAMNCPLRLFAALGRELRIRLEWTDIEGVALDKNKWIVCAAPGDPAIIPTAILSMLKMTPLEDWASAVELFAIPWVIGMTDRDPADPQFKQLENFVRNARNRFAGVIGKEADVKIITGLTQPPPHSSLVEYLDRAIASVWRGGDLSTMSRGGDSNGASLQVQETSAIAKTDRRMIEAVFDKQLTRRFLRFVFGAETRPLAYFRFVAEDRAERQQRIQDLRAAWEMGLTIPENFVRSTLGIPDVAEDDKVVRRDALTTPTISDPAGTGAYLPSGYGYAAANAAEKSESAEQAEAEAILAEAQAEQFAALRKAAEYAAAADTEEEFRARLTALKAQFGAIESATLAGTQVADALAELVSRGVRKDFASYLQAMKGAEK